MVIHMEYIFTNHLSNKSNRNTNFKIKPIWDKLLIEFIYHSLGIQKSFGINLEELLESIFTSFINHRLIILGLDLGLRKLLSFYINSGMFYVRKGIELSEINLSLMVLFKAIKYKPSKQNQTKIPQ